MRPRTLGQLPRQAQGVTVTESGFGPPRAARYCMCSMGAPQTAGYVPCVDRGSDAMPAILSLVPSDGLRPGEGDRRSTGPRAERLTLPGQSAPDATASRRRTKQTRERPGAPAPEARRGPSRTPMRRGPSTPATRPPPATGATSVIGSGDRRGLEDAVGVATAPVPQSGHVEAVDCDCGSMRGEGRRSRRAERAKPGRRSVPTLGSRRSIDVDRRSPVRDAARGRQASCRWRRLKRSDVGAGLSIRHRERRRRTTGSPVDDVSGERARLPVQGEDVPLVGGRRAIPRSGAREARRTSASESSHRLVYLCRRWPFAAIVDILAIVRPA